MHKLFLLSRLDIDMSLAELSSLCPGCNIEVYEDVALVEDAPAGLEKRLALSKSVHRLVFRCDISMLDDTIAKQEWNNLITGSFAVRSEGKTGVEKKLADMVYRKLKDPKVNLEAPITQVFFIFRKQKVFCTCLEAIIPGDYTLRKAHNRPALHPSSMDPRLARAAVNLTGLSGGTILDPFCGSGGILIEAGLMGLTCRGIDISEGMVMMAKKNLEFFKIESDIQVGDAFQSDLECDAIVTDIPYGKSTITDKRPMELLAEFLEYAEKKGVSKIVIMFPSEIENAQIPKGYNLIHDFSHYVHKSMTKRILLLKSR